MRKFIAFLRAINVGGHTVKMDRLREIFSSMGYSNIETFIASGNVIFFSKTNDPATLKNTIEQKLKNELGFEVKTFIRTPDELQAIANHKPFPKTMMDAATALNVALLDSPLDEKSKKSVTALKSDADEFQVHNKEVYWLCIKKQSESKFSNAVLEKTIGQSSTMRGLNTIRKMAEKYGE